MLQECSGYGPKDGATKSAKNMLLEYYLYFVYFAILGVTAHAINPLLIGVGRYAETGLPLFMEEI